MKSVLRLVAVGLLATVPLLTSCASGLPAAPPVTTAVESETPTLANDPLSTPVFTASTSAPTTTTPAPTTTTPAPAPTTTPPPIPATTPPPSSTPAPPAPVDTTSPTWTYWGPSTFGNDYPAAPGTRIDFTILGSRQGPDGKPVVGVRLLSVGLSADRVYYLWAKGLSETEPGQMTPIEIGVLTDGSLINKSTNDPITLELSSYARGEALVVALMTADKSVIAYGKVIPFPIEVRQGRARVWVELLSDTGTFFAVYGAGFEANEEIAATSTSEGETARFTVKCDSQGRFTAGVLPAVAGKTSGQASYTVTAKSGTLTVSFDWGPPALRRY